uniref:Uncharacterized protein n=1 Tax=Anguilla anguilla TaxID=7936 RepID=A0A0E9X1M4_ANGAN
MDASSRIKHHVTNHTSSQASSASMTVTPVACTAPRSQFNRAPFGTRIQGVCTNVRLKNLQELHNAIESAQTRISKECFQRLVESTAWRPQAVLQANAGPYPVQDGRT